MSCIASRGKKAIKAYDLRLFGQSGQYFFAGFTGVIMLLVVLAAVVECCFAVQFLSLAPKSPLQLAVAAACALAGVAAEAIAGAASIMIAAKPETSVRLFIVVTPGGCGSNSNRNPLMILSFLRDDGRLITNS